MSKSVNNNNIYIYICLKIVLSSLVKGFIVDKKSCMVPLQVRLIDQRES